MIKASMKYVIWAAVLALVGGGFFLANERNNIEVSLVKSEHASNTATGTNALLLPPPEATSTPPKAQSKGKVPDIENQRPLPNPPAVIKAVYATAYSIGSPTKLQYFIDLIKSTELNAIVIDIKDYTGYVLYDIHNSNVDKYNTKEIHVARINEAIKRFHDEGIYVIARQTVFQDPALAKARPDLALKNIAGLGTSTPMSAAPVWRDSKGLSWMDPASKDVWDYNVTIAKDAAARGFDEINFDYVRFASDGSLGNIGFPFYNPKTTLKLTVIKSFFKYLREQTTGITISADLFGLTTVNNDDLGIGQSLAAAAEFFDYVSPMTYPSHYASGFIGYKNPAAYPYEVLRYSMEKALQKLTTNNLRPGTKASSTMSSTTLTNSTSSVTSSELRVKYKAKLRPWLQDFNLGATYDAAKIHAQIIAVDEVVKKTPLYNGWLLWNASNIYTKAALGPD